LISSTIIAQQTNPFACGTTQGRSPWLKKFQKTLQNGEHRSQDGEVYVGMHLRSVLSDDGASQFPDSKLFETLCTLQEDFADTDIRFYLKSIEFLRDSGLDDHEDIRKGIRKMLELNIEGGINVYIVNNPAGNCGYAAPWAGAAIGDNCNDPDDHTWAHEMGHTLGLPHPFFGWEGGISYDDMEGHNYNNPAPNTVLRKAYTDIDAYLNDDFYIDTIQVEMVDRVNCYESGDGFCDTEADYLNYRWLCDDDGVSEDIQTDPDNTKFYSDASLFMSYSLDRCTGRFSEEQSEAMKAFALDIHAEISTTDNPTQEVAQDAEFILHDVYDEGLDYQDISFEWDPVENADYYYVQIGIEPSFGVVLFDTLISSTDFVLNELSDNFSYHWRISAFNAIEFCNPARSEGQEIIFTDVTNTKDPIEYDLKVYPNPIGSKKELFIEGNKNSYEKYQIYNSQGEYIQNGILIADQEDLKININKKLNSGIYFLKLIGEKGSTIIQFIQIESN